MSAIVDRPPSAQRMSLGFGLDDFATGPTQTGDHSNVDPPTGDLIDFGGFDDDEPVQKNFGASASDVQAESNQKCDDECTKLGATAAFLKQMRETEQLLEDDARIADNGLRVYYFAKRAVCHAIDHKTTEGISALFSIFTPTDSICNESECRALAVGAAALCATCESSSAALTTWRQDLIAAIGRRSPLTVVYRQALEDCDTDSAVRFDWHRAIERAREGLKSTANENGNDVASAVASIAGAVAQYNAAAKADNLDKDTVNAIDETLDAAIKTLGSVNGGLTHAMTAICPSAWIAFHDSVSRGMTIADPASATHEHIDSGRAYAVLRYVTRHWQPVGIKATTRADMSLDQMEKMRAKVSRVVGDPDCLDLLESALLALEKLEKANTGKEE